MSFQDLEAGHVRGAPRRNGRGLGAGGGGGASQAVASGVFQINTAVATFQRLVNTLGTPKDTPDLRDRMCVVTYPTPLCALRSTAILSPQMDTRILPWFSFDPCAEFRDGPASRGTWLCDLDLGFVPRRCLLLWIA